MCILLSVRRLNHTGSMASLHAGKVSPRYCPVTGRSLKKGQMKIFKSKSEAGGKALSRPGSFYYDH